MTLIPKPCSEISPKCPKKQKHGYLLGWWHGQIKMAEKYHGTPCQAISMQQKIEALETEVDKWKTAFSAQSNKLQSVLHIDGVHEILTEIGKE